MSKIIIGSDTLQIEDFSSIVYGSIVVLDTAALSQVKRFSNTIKGKFATLNLPPVSSNNSKFLNYYQSRCAILTKLVAIIQGKSGVRSEVAEFLAHLLNNEIIPKFPISESQAGVNVSLLNGTCELLISEGSKPMDVNYKLPLEGNPIETNTLNELLTSPGLLAFAVTTLRDLLPTIDAVAALSCEAFSTFETPFGDSHNEKSRPHNGQCISSENIRALLSVSKNLTNATATSPLDPVCFRCIPQIHGPAYDAATHARLVARIELNSSPFGPSDSSSTSGGSFIATPVMVVVSTLLSSIAPIANNIIARLNCLISSPLRVKEANENTIELVKLAQTHLDIIKSAINLAASNVINMDHDSGISAASALCDSVKALQDLSSIEAAASCGILSRRQEIMAAEAAEIEKIKALKAAEAAEKFGGGDKKKKDDKKDKKPKSKGLILGLGTREILEWIVTYCFVGSSESFDSVAGSKKISLGFEPSNSDITSGISPFVQTLVKKINSGGVKRKPTVAKGARDFMPEQMQVRAQAFEIIRSVFSSHGAVEIDTPVFELRSTLMDKYGEDQKLIFELADQGGEQLALRYDLTVPFARFLAVNPVGNIKRFHISKVYRRDQPQMKRGRFREFYQCDYDVAGTYGRMIPDAEVLCVGAEILSKLPLGGFKIKLNHRELLDAMLDICGVVPSKFRIICSAIDKLDKMSWEEVKAEMVDVKGLSTDVADKIGKFVQLKGDAWTLYNKLTSENSQWFGLHESATKALEDLRLLFTYLEAMGQLDKIFFDLSLARGLDYYTGVIYEAVLTSPNQVGSIAAGGRYDKLVGMFSEADVPCVGISIGVERVFVILEELLKERNMLKTKPVSVTVVSADKGAEMLKKRMEYAAQLWAKGISASFAYAENATLKKQLDGANTDGVRWVIIFGSTEIESKTLNIKDLVLHTEITIPEATLVEELIKLNVESNLPPSFIIEEIISSIEKKDI